MAALYQDDLAHVQIQGFAGDAQAATPQIIQLLENRGIAGGCAVDIGCGAGITLKGFAEAGFDVHGIEPSPALAAEARRLVPDATVEVASAGAASLPSCDVITALGEVFGYMPPSGRGPSLRTIFAKCAKSLRPGGFLIFDLLLAGKGPPLDYRTWVSGDDWAVLTEGREDVARAMFRRDIQIFRKSGTHYRRSDERHVLRVPSVSQVLSDLRACGFAARSARAYGTVAMRPRRAAFIARRKL